MSWTPLPTGTFTGIDWAQPGATRGFDPYLIWAEADQFAAYGGATPVWLPVALELKPGKTIAQLLQATSRQWLQVPPVYTSAAAPAGLRFCTGRVRPRFFQALRPGGELHAIVKRLEMGLPSDVPEDPHGAALAAAPVAASHGATGLTGKVFGLIDDSLALAHANFLGTGNTPRTAFFWRQDRVGGGRVPVAMGYGRELTAPDIHAAIDRHTYHGLVDEAAVYTELGLSRLGKRQPSGKTPFHALDLSASHGTHVADLAAGPRMLEARTANLPPNLDAPPSWAAADDDASRCPIVAVQLDYRTVKDTSGGSMSVHVLDALMYILSCCAPSAQVVVNVSFGTLAGPHDGTSLLEAAMEQLLGLACGKLDIVLAAGNSYQARTHANVQVQPMGEANLHWQVLPDDATPSFVELWLQEGCEDVAIEVIPPGRPALPALTLGDSGMWMDGHQRPSCALIYPSRVATGERGTCALLALAPTFSLHAGLPTTLSGVWRLRLRNTGQKPAVVDAYVERDDTVTGARTGARQSHFTDDPTLPHNQQYDMQAYVDDPARSTPVRRSGNLNSIASGQRTVSAGGMRITDGSWAHYSPLKPDPDHARPARPAVVKTPDQAAFSDESPALHGLSAAGTFSGGMARLVGTSDAAPQICRKLLDR
jgi:hypothetical protein